MTYWMIDVRDRVGQRVAPTCPSPQDWRFRKVEADTFVHALRIARTEVMTMEDVERRYPRLIRSMRWAGILTIGEAVNAVYGYRVMGDPFGGAEAVAHMGGALVAVRAGIRARHAARRVSWR